MRSSNIREYVITALLLITICLVTPVVEAKSVNSNAGTSGFSFLRINVGARPVAMGGAFTGLADDETSLYYNPAGIARFEESRFIAGYHNYFVDLQSGVVGYIHSLGENQTVAVHATYLNYGDFIQTDVRGNIEGSFGGGDILFGLTFAMKRTEQLHFGATMKFIYEKIQDFSATGVAFDFGARYTTNRGRYSGGLMLQNLGTQLSSFREVKDGLPTTIRGGFSAQPKGLPFLLAGDVILPFDNDINFAVGAEYNRVKPLHLRLGWNSFGSTNYSADGESDVLAGFSAGLGIDYRNLQFSYALTLAADLGENHRITVTGGI